MAEGRAASADGTIPDRRCTASRCTVSGKSIETSTCASGAPAPSLVRAVQQASGNHLRLDFRRALEDREDAGIA
jgi:hypothetical protein